VQTEHLIGERDNALDFTKGALVVLMVFYHWGIYFDALTNTDAPDFFRFLTPAFIFLTGWIISAVYPAKYSVNSGRRRRRLILRGAKLLALFTLLNLIIVLIRFRTDIGGAVQDLPGDLYDIYATGNRLTAFRILVPIAYLLLLSGAVPGLTHGRTWAIAALTILSCALIHADELRGGFTVNLVLLSFGLLGLAFGRIGVQRTKQLAGRFSVIALLYLAYVAVVIRYGQLYWVQIIAVLSNLLLLYGIGRFAKAEKPGWSLVILIGRYSLIGYVGQIAILQALIAIHNLYPRPWGAIVYLPIALVLTGLLVLMVDALRRRSLAMDQVYKLVFA
jgi:fucose 4-O-acetylase-like acetyltransferase